MNAPWSMSSGRKLALFVRKSDRTSIGLGVDWVGEGKTDKGPNAYHSTGLICEERREVTMTEISLLRPVIRKWVSSMEKNVKRPITTPVAPLLAEWKGSCFRSQRQITFCNCCVFFQ